MGGIEAIAMSNTVLSGGVTMGSMLSVWGILMAGLVVSVAGIWLARAHRRAPRRVQVIRMLPAGQRV